jgi:hypothetical protein
MAALCFIAQRRDEPRLANLAVRRLDAREEMSCKSF